MTLRILGALATTALSAQASLIITGVIDGDLTGGIPKAVVVTATSDIPDLSIWGFGSANNGGGTDGQEYTFSGSATTGDVFVVAGTPTSESFFNTYYLGLNISEDSAANINGDDAIELFENGVIVDTYGDPATDGNGESWEYTNGYAVRIGGTAGTFDQANYDSQFRGLEGLTEAEQAGVLQSAFGFTPVPEPSTALLGGFGLLALLRRRR